MGCVRALTERIFPNRFVFAKELTGTGSHS
jgi:hypothetical protein